MGLEFLLRAAVKVANDGVGPNGIVWTLLMYGAMQRLHISLDPITASKIEKVRGL